ncbi:MAG: CHRD domain-containing protein [Chthoniobacterales bacterium]
MRIRFFKCSVLLIISLAAAAHAHELVCTASLSGPNESPSNDSLAAGSATVTIDFDLFTMRIQANFSGLQGTVTSAHIHAATAAQFSGTAGVATQVPSFEMFPTGVTSGTYDHTFDLTLDSSYNPDFIAANGGTISTASNALFAALVNGKAYLDIHTTAFGEGEIRGFLVGPKIVVTHISATPSGTQTAIAIEGIVEPSGAGVLLQRSSDLQTWDPVTIGDSDPANGEFSFNTAESSSTPRRFYRVIDLLEPNVHFPSYRKQTSVITSPRE